MAGRAARGCVCSYALYIVPGEVSSPLSYLMRNIIGCREQRHWTRQMPRGRKDLLFSKAAGGCSAMSCLPSFSSLWCMGGCFQWSLSLVPMGVLQCEGHSKTNLCFAWMWAMVLVSFPKEIWLMQSHSPSTSVCSPASALYISILLSPWCFWTYQLKKPNSLDDN